MSDEVTFLDDDIDEISSLNNQPKCACLLVLDTSASMSGKPIDELNKAVADFAEELRSDELASQRIDVGIISFGGSVTVESDFKPAEFFEPPTLSAKLNTPLGQAVEQAVEMITKKKSEYRNEGTPVYRPWVILITDGAPTDDWSHNIPLISTGEAEKSFSFYAIGVENANMEVLTSLSVARAPMKLKGLRFTELFQWLSASLQTVSGSGIGGHVSLPSRDGWGVASI
jgi:uncharacterized protein YegL